MGIGLNHFGCYCCLGSVYPQTNLIHLVRSVWGNNENHMKNSPRHYTNSPSIGLLAIGTLSLLLMIMFQAFGVSSMASANSRDEFPGRRQGGGTHWVTPSPSMVDYQH